MKKRVATLSITLLLALLISGGTRSWFISRTGGSKDYYNMGIIEMKVVESESQEIRIQNSGSSQAYVRVRLLPQWTNPSLSNSNVELELSLEDWTERQADGYYYYKKILEENEITSSLVRDVRISDLTEAYEGESLTLKVVAEGVQIAERAWKDLWGISDLPFASY